MTTQKILNSESFSNEVLKSSIPVAAIFSATWCGPCKMYKETLKEVIEHIQSNNQSNKFKIVTIDVDEAPEVTNKYNIRTLPTTLILVKEEIKEEFKGALTKEKLLEYINKYISI